ncbi:MAG: hypothetical protein LC791_02990 [Acidobacteria bacterium]|nr:hypothetical protein [Acidobacteriota bacterium]
MSLRLSGSVEHSIRAHGRETYPDECCGALIGRGDVVYEALALANVTDEGPRHAWPVFAYVIVAVEAGRDGDLRSWRLRSDRSQFDAEDVDIDQRVAKQ